MDGQRMFLLLSMLLHVLQGPTGCLPELWSSRYALPCPHPVGVGPLSTFHVCCICFPVSSAAQRRGLLSPCWGAESPAAPTPMLGGEQVLSTAQCCGLVLGPEGSAAGTKCCVGKREGLCMGDWVLTYAVFQSWAPGPRVGPWAAR